MSLVEERGDLHRPRGCLPRPAIVRRDEHAGRSCGIHKSRDRRIDRKRVDVPPRNAGTRVRPGAGRPSRVCHAHISRGGEKVFPCRVDRKYVDGGAAQFQVRPPPRHPVIPGGTQADPPPVREKRCLGAFSGDRHPGRDPRQFPSGPSPARAEVGRDDDPPLRSRDQAVRCARENGKGEDPVEVPRYARRAPGAPAVRRLHD